MDFNKNFMSVKSIFNSGRTQNISFRIHQIEMLVRMCEDNFDEMMKICNIEDQNLTMSEFDYAMLEVRNILENSDDLIEMKKVRFKF